MSELKLIIDPGHGGGDSGAIAVDGSKEKDWNLEISKYQYKRFLELGLNKDEVKITRDKDEFIDLNERAITVRKSRATVCICNHNNSYNTEAKGAEVIHSVFNNGWVAEQILNEFKKSCGHTIRRHFSKKNSSGLDWYAMNRMTGSVTTYIIEYAFLDNIDDYSFLKKNWKCLAEAVVKVISKELDIQYKAPVKELTWKEQIMEEAFDKGLITSKNHHADERADKWFVLEVIMNALDYAIEEDSKNVRYIAGKEYKGEL